MNPTSFTHRAALAGVLLAAAIAQPAWSHGTPRPVLHGRTVQVEVYDRAERSVLPIHRHASGRYVVGQPGHEYALRIRNRTPGRVLVVTSVDGINVISGETAAHAQSGYVLEPWGQVEIAGWRKNLARTAAFYFSEHEASYAARTGRPDNVGVIGVAVFREKPARVGAVAPGIAERRNAAPAASESAARDDAAGAQAPAAPPAASPPAPAKAEAAAPSADAAEAPVRQQSKSLARLGTGHGRSETSRASVVRFERASDTPAETVAIRYDRLENLIALGIIPAPRPVLAHRAPDPFPGAMRFAPDPID